MKLVIGPGTPDKHNLNVEDTKSIDKICGLDKSIEYQVYLLDCEINEIGLIIGTEILLDELFIAFNITNVYTNNINDIIKEYCLYYSVPLYEI